MLHVLERRLGEAAYLGGDTYSIADIAIWPGRALATAMKPSLTETYPNTARWTAGIAARPAVKRGLSAELSVPERYRQRQARLTPEQWSNMFGERMHGAVRGSTTVGPG